MTTTSLPNPKTTRKFSSLFTEESVGLGGWKTTGYGLETKNSQSIGYRSSSKSLWSGVSVPFTPSPTLIFDHSLEEEAQRAKTAILSLKDDWDGEGSTGYSEKTWDRAMDFLDIHVQEVFRKCGHVLVPKILPGPDGSIDFHWRSERFELLVNVPESDDVSVSFYGDQFNGRNSFKGPFDRASLSRILVTWLGEVCAGL
jgi:hypothetical protein